MIHVSKKRAAGFTLIEMLIAVGVGSVVLVTAVGVLASLHAIQRRAINAQNVHDNIRFALEAMSREIRTGDQFCNVPAPGSCSNAGTPTDCSWPNGCDEFTFRQTATNEVVTYKLDGDDVVKVKREIGNFLPLTDPQRTVTKLHFYTTGVNDFAEHELVTILLEVVGGTTAKPNELVTLNAQTSVSKRKIGE